MKCWTRFTQKMKNIFKAKEIQGQDLVEEEEKLPEGQQEEQQKELGVDMHDINQEMTPVIKVEKKTPTKEEKTIE